MSKARKLHCSFCKRQESEVAKLVAGPRVYICDRCVEIANRLMSGDDPGESPTVEAGPSLWQRLRQRLARHNRWGGNSFAVAE